MQFSYDINFPALTFTSPGTYLYTVRELAPADSKEEWKADHRAYPVKVTVTAGADGALTAAVSYPEGFPIFVNTYAWEERPPACPVCRRFACLPFPMFWFVPPQKAEYMAFLQSTP
ncbi:MAG: hypothetical protein FWG38_08055 [Defluviitaleaceae bacterium]|nr:hypothetical protein [Defluviitaleaceae bacterium]